MWKNKIFLLLLLFNGSAALAQSSDFAQFQQALKAAQLDYLAPLEQTYRPIAVVPNDYYPYLYAIQSKNKALEIRYSIHAFTDPEATTSNIPHLQCFAIANSLSDNQIEQAIVVHNIPAKELKEKYHADWGSIIYFQPKEQFSDKRHCKMLSLFAAGKAAVYIFFLFDEPSEELEHQRYGLRFMPTQNN